LFSTGKRGFCVRCLGVARQNEANKREGPRVISAITGTLVRVDEDHAQLQVGPVVLEVLVPASDVTELHASLGEELTFHTMFYLQGEASGGSIEPRLIGFLRADDKRFFEKFITVKGIGPRTALKALHAPVGEIAQAIESKDARALVQLDGIGKRTAELIIAELAGKVTEFAAPFTATMRGPTMAKRSPAEEDAVAALMQLGERRIDAEHLLDRVRQSNPKLGSASEFIREMLRARTVRV
jgi:Holliday junction DNA helicase RuvA